MTAVINPFAQCARSCITSEVFIPSWQVLRALFSRVTVECDKVDELTVRWIKWRNKSQKHKNRLKEARELADRISDLEKDEKWKREVQSA